MIVYRVQYTDVQVLIFIFHSTSEVRLVQENHSVYTERLFSNCGMNEFKLILNERFKPILKLKTRPFGTICKCNFQSTSKIVEAKYKNKQYLFEWEPILYLIKSRFFLKKVQTILLKKLQI